MNNNIGMDCSAAQDLMNDVSSLMFLYRTY